jgi:hypothetical protein
MMEKPEISVSAKAPRKQRRPRLPAKKKAPKKSIRKPQIVLATISW